MKVALIGTSGVGKSGCLSLLGEVAGEMDRGLNTGTPQSAEAMLGWISQSRQRVVAVSVHIKGLEELAAKKKLSDPGLSEIRFVYLFCRKPELERRLFTSEPPRTKDNIEATRRGFEKMDQIFRVLMDEFIDTTDIPICDVANRIRVLIGEKGQPCR